MGSESQEENADVVICRACIGECVEYKSLHKQGIILGEVRTLASMLSFITNMDFPPDEGEGFPVHICARCVQSLAKSYTFKKMVLETDDVLRRQYTELGCLVMGTDTGEGDADTNSGSVIEDLDTESAVSIVEEHHLESEEIEITEADDEQLHELATAAQFKRTIENLEYVALTILDDCGDGDEVHDQNGLEQETADEGEIVVHEMAEMGEEVYPTEHDVEDDSKAYETEIFEVKLEEVSQDECVDLVTINSEVQEHKAKRKRHISMGTDSEAKQDLKFTTKMRKKTPQPKPPNPDLQCKVCGKQLSNLNSFKYHMQLHSDATPYLCSLCGEGFKTRNAYEGHIIIHDPNNPNTCELCGKSYRQSSSLRTHMLTHTGERPFQCDICGKSMTQKSGYKKHMLVHTGEKPHVCDVCGREFRYSSNLIAHKRCHTGERPYNCPHCKRGFPTSEQAKRHSLVHTGERPFVCEVCNKRFKRRSSLISHQHTHNAEPEILVDHKVCKSNVVELY